MIQRIQTVYLFLIFAIGLILIWQNPVYAWFDASQQPSAYVLMIWSSYAGTAPGTEVVYFTDLLSMVVSLSIMVLAIVSIFLFKNRTLQMTCIKISLLSCLMFIVVLLSRYWMLKSAHTNFNGHLGFPIVWPVIMLISGLMAYRGVRSDDLMVRGMDRIR